MEEEEDEEDENGAYGAEEEPAVTDEWLEDRRTSVLRRGDGDPASADQDRTTDTPKVWTGDRAGGWGCWNLI